ncbi:MAG: helix-turn-helix domain-containing protein [Parvularculaceae bacterium]
MTTAAQSADAPPIDSPLLPDDGSTPARIRRAALEVFVAKGVDAATTREIAAAAGLSEGALYRHFPGKEALAGEVFTAIHARLAGLIRTAAAPADGVAERTAAIVDAYAHAAGADWPAFVFHLLQAHRFLPTPPGTDNPVDAAEEIIIEAMGRGEIVRADAGLVAGMALGVVLQTAQQIAYGRLDGPLARHGDALKIAALAVMRPIQS